MARHQRVSVISGAPRGGFIVLTEQFTAAAGLTVRVTVTGAGGAVGLNSHDKAGGHHQIKLSEISVGSSGCSGIIVD